MQKISLNGTWKLSYFKQNTLDIKTPEDLRKNAGTDVVDAIVPGNVELDLSRAGVLPEDLFFGENMHLAEKYEDYEWWYETEFDIPSEYAGKKLSLLFEGTDCIAEYFLNGVKIGESDNMFIPFEFSIDENAKVGEKNSLCVHIKSAVLEAYNKDISMFTLANGWYNRNYESVQVRKAPHSYSWDIMPRAVSAGIWRDVFLVAKTDFEIKQFFCYTETMYPGGAFLRFCYELDTECVPKGTTIEINGVCGDSSFSVTKPVTFKAGAFEHGITSPKLWWPYGYGEPNLYEVNIRFINDGKVLCEKTVNVGIRQVRLLRTDTTDGKHGKFEFQINGETVVCKGSNWVPMDAYHSRDKSRYAKALELVKDVGCNILRCWGGNVYESEEFFDFCDKNGVMVWQDFSMACHPYPQDEAFLETIRREATAIIRLYRQHPSIILWSGDNENDALMQNSHTAPSKNRITREILPQVVASEDAGRPFLASSPYVCDELYESKEFEKLPEDHLWGARDYFKSKFYVNSNAHFVSETGYHGCPSVESIKKFIDKDHLWPIYNEQWTLHSTDWMHNDSRVALMDKQIVQFFGRKAENLDEFSFMSQVSQAEAKKYFIERVRINPNKKGIIWWNLLDGWPQMSDAVVDYYYDKKLAYHYIKRSQQPFTIMCDEIFDWGSLVVAANDTRQTVAGEIKITDIESGEVRLQGGFAVAAGQKSTIGKLELRYSDKGMLLLDWFINGQRYFNPYLYGYPAFDVEKYKEWLEKLK